MNGNFCGTCRFWDPRYPENPGLGVCSKIGVILFANDAAIVHHDMWDDGSPTSEFAVVRTTATFGCVTHTPKPFPVLL